MQLLVATTRTQGQVPGDYNFCIPGEVLWFSWVCDRDRRNTQHACGCGRGFGGLTSHRATTTAEVVERDFSPDELRLAIRTSLADQGWLPSSLPADEQAEIVDEAVGHMLSIAALLPVGTIVRRDVDDVHAYPPLQEA